MNDEGEEGTHQKIISGQNTVHYISYKLLPKFRMLSKHFFDWKLAQMDKDPTTKNTS